MLHAGTQRVWCRIPAQGGRRKRASYRPRRQLQPGGVVSRR